MSRTALIVVDMINSYEHEDAEKLVRFGAWRSSRQELIETALNGPYGHLVKPIEPPDGALFVVKARHSIFFQTPLEYLLSQEEIERIVLIGQATEQCIVYSALDAYIRHLAVAVPRDAVAHIHEHLAEASLEMMQRNMDAEICQAEGCEL